MNYYPFDSRNILYKSIQGALAEGENLRLKVLFHKTAEIFSAFLELQDDATNEYTEIAMTPKDCLGDYRFYECTVTPKTGLYWYHFKFTTNLGEFRIKRCDRSFGFVSDDGENWQLTVYDKDFSTPDWLKGGIIYQIFPDRFYNSGSEKQNVPDDRFIVTDWEKQPEFRQDDRFFRLGNDYYGGDLNGIKEKLPYLKSLGVSCIYLNPIFEAHSNHRYNTADYMKVDPLLGTKSDLEELVKSAKEQGIYIILDGVFSHTGDDSIYFNRYNRYDSVGAFNSKNSPYYNWYKFDNSKIGYSAWWGVPTLPEVYEDEPSYTDFITGENGVIDYWLKTGVKGFRLDVADELPDKFLKNLRKAVKKPSRDNFLLGEVWEDASNKISYGKRRKFLLGNQLDSVMNYPFSNAIIEYLQGGAPHKLINTVAEISENYPKPALNLLMNHIGTHDTPRILTLLGKGGEINTDREWQARQKLTQEEYLKGSALLKVGALLQYTLPGVPSLYYGDEVGMQGYGDPFCRGTYPWGKEDTSLLSFYKCLGAVRREQKVFKDGDFIPVYADWGEVAYIRKSGDEQILIAATRWHGGAEIKIPEEFINAECLLGQKPDGNKLHLSPYGFSVLKI